MNVFLLHLGLLISHAVDLLLTFMVTPGREMNPMAATLWSQHGFGSLVLLKVVVWVFMLAYHLAVLRWLPDLSKVVWVSMVVGLVAMVALVIWNVQMVF